MSDTNKFIVLLNKLIINKRTHSSHNNCKTQNTYKGPRHDVTDEVALPAASDSSFTKNGRQLSVQTTLPNSVLQSAKSLPSVHRVFSSALFWLMSASWQQKFSFYVKNVICMFLLICSGTDVISRRIYRRFSKGDFIVTATPTR